MNLFKIGMITAMAASMALAQPAAANRGAGRPMARHRMMMMGLSLTDAQKQQAKQIFQQTRESAQPLVKQLQDNRAALQAAVQANDVNQIQTLSTQQGALQGQLAAVRAEGMAKFYASLTPEQRAKVQQRQSRRQQRQE